MMSCEMPLSDGEIYFEGINSSEEGNRVGCPNIKSSRFYMCEIPDQTDARLLSPSGRSQSVYDRLRVLEVYGPVAGILELGTGQASDADAAQNGSGAV